MEREREERGERPRKSGNLVLPLFPPLSVPLVSPALAASLRKNGNWAAREGRREPDANQTKMEGTSSWPH